MDDAHSSTQQAIQIVVAKVGQDLGGHAIPEDVEPVLAQAIADAGLPEQPAPWVRATANEISAGRIVILDPRDQLSEDAIDTGSDDDTEDGGTPPPA